MDIQHLVDRLEDLIDEGRHVPLSKLTMIDEERALEIIDQMRISVPEQIEKASRMINQRDRLIAQANEEATRIVELARERSQELVERDAVSQTANNRAKNIIDKLLIYSRRSSDFELELVSLAAVVEGAHDLVKPKLKQQKIRYLCEGQGDYLVKAKTVELQQVLVNLLINAADAYADGVAERPLQVRYGGDAGGSCWIEVEDQAGGGPEEIQDQLFDPFFTTKAIGKGTGLGLSIGQEICQQYQGDLTFVSHPGQGTVFRMTLPRVG